MSETIEIGAYLLSRLKELGVKSIFGVPGDFELTLLDIVPEVGLRWHGTANELIAAYAADGYARFNGFGAVITTFGPGELSALNGLAGAYAEAVPVLHIVGYPSTKAQRTEVILHHSMGDGRFDAYHEMSKQISCATTVLRNEINATSEIDRVLREMLYHRRPGYIGIPTDMIRREIPHVSTLMSAIALDRQEDQVDDTGIVVAMIKQRILSAEKLAVIVDAGVIRYGIVNETWQLIEMLKAPYFTTPMGKGGITERHTRFGGLYAGVVSDATARDYVETADCVLRIGNLPSDLNTGAFSTKYLSHALIDFRQFSVNVEGTIFNTGLKRIVTSLTESLRSDAQVQAKSWPACQLPFQEKILPSKDLITFDWLLQRLGEAFQPGDLIVVETGSISVGIPQVPLPQDATMFTQTLWGSIGYACAAAVGASYAVKEQGQKFKRTIILTGDGSIQMTVQAVSDLLPLNPIIIVLNNDGYTCERAINGPIASYNDIPQWDWQSVLHTFGPNVQSRSFRAKTPQELDTLLSDSEITNAKCTQLVEIVMNKHDVPKAVNAFAQAITRENLG